MQVTEYADYPVALPKPQGDFSGTHTTPTQTTQFTSGKRRKRKIGRVVVKDATLNWLFTPDEYDVFIRWWEDDLDAGCNPFQINMPSGGNGQTGRHVVQFTDDPNFSHEECNWRISVGCVIYPYPKINDEKMLYIIFDDPETFALNMKDVLGSYYTRNF